jgi:hypothetical protein
MRTFSAIRFNHFLQMNHILTVLRIIFCWEEDAEAEAALRAFARQGS